MKYLKPYNESNQFDEINQTLEEICFELTDQGFIVDIDSLYNPVTSRPNNISIKRDERLSPFSIFEIWDTIKRIEDYITTCGFTAQSDIELIRGQGWRNNYQEYMNLMMSTEHKYYKNIRQVEINFFKK